MVAASGQYAASGDCGPVSSGWMSGGQAAQYQERLSAPGSRKPLDAQFQVTATGTIVIRPSAPGLQLDIPATAKAIAAAAFSTDQPTASLVVRVADPRRTTEV